MPQEIETFVRLSQTLTGVEPLDLNLAGLYLDRLRTEYPTQMAAALTAFAAIANASDLDLETERTIVNDNTLGPLAQQIIAIWYTSEFAGAAGTAKTGTQLEFNRGLLWPIIGA